MQATPARSVAAVAGECSVAIAASTADSVIITSRPCSWQAIMDRSMPIAAGARVGEGATKVAIEVFAVITAVRESVFKLLAARAAARGEALATTLAYSG